MTGTDLIVLAPWIAFVVGLAVVCLVLLRSRGVTRPRRSPRPVPGTPADRGPTGPPDPQEARRPERNAEARPK